MSNVKELDEILKEYVYGFACGACDTGGSDGGQGDCKNCKGYGIVGWQTTDLDKALNRHYYQKFLEIIGENDPNIHDVLAIENQNHLRDFLRQQAKLKLLGEGE